MERKKTLNGSPTTICSAGTTATHNSKKNNRQAIFCGQADYEFYLEKLLLATWFRTRNS